MLQVKIIEASRSVLKELGLETDINDGDELAATQIFGATRSASVTNGHGNSAAFGGGAGLALSQDPVASARAILD
ncbi:MAG TPA: hypothetical protein DEA55_05230, partial [Rhodospirillaceae bacterium]|nr:hypothetical protein [Rhodospirillaceae bacterium]